MCFPFCECSFQTVRIFCFSHLKSWVGCCFMPSSCTGLRFWGHMECIGGGHGLWEPPGQCEILPTYASRYCILLTCLHCAGRLSTWVECEQMGQSSRSTRCMGVFSSVLFPRNRVWLTVCVCVLFSVRSLDVPVLGSLQVPGMIICPEYMIVGRQGSGVRWGGSQ